MSMTMEPEFTGQKLLRLVVDIQGAVGANGAGLTPLGIAVMQLTEAAANADPELAAEEAIINSADTAGQ